MKRRVFFVVALAIAVGVALVLSLPFVMAECFGTEPERTACLQTKRLAFGAYVIALIAAIGTSIAVYLRSGRAMIFVSLLAVAFAPFVIGIVAWQV